MLQQLIIKNYALIDHTDISLNKGMSVITGETGAGKSIMLGAIGLLLGQKADSQVLLDKNSKCVVEATFDISRYDLKADFDEAEMEYDDTTIIRREILPTGKSRAFVNDTPANVSFLKLIGQKLIDIHSQHQNMLLSQESFHLDVVDAMAHTENELTEYAEVYAKFRACEKELNELKKLNSQQIKELDFNKHLLSELIKAELTDPDELTELEKQQTMWDKAEDIKSALCSAIDSLSADDSGIVSGLRNVCRNVNKISEFLPKDENIADRVEAARIDMEDVVSSLQNLSERIEFDPDEQRRVTDRINLMNSLLQRHSVVTLSELIAIREDLQKKVDAVESFDEKLEEATNKRNECLKEMHEKATALSNKRQNVFEKTTSYVEGLLHEMGMQNAKFVIEHTITDFNAKGFDSIKFLFAANKNGIPTDISKVASGGEMSRVMLSIKSLLSSTKNLPTIIFDEIDTGVSGDVADKMGRIMTEMAANMQVLAITHLPQVASRGAQHYKVFKQDTDERTISHITLLSNEERVQELAKMLSGSEVSEAALANAKSLLNL